MLLANEVVVYNNDFSSSIGSEWSANARVLSTPSGQALGSDRFGSPSPIGSETLTLALAGLPAHSSVHFSVDLYTLRSWDGNKTDFGPDQWDLDATGTSSDIQPLTTFSNYVSTNQSYPDAHPGGSNPGTTGAAATGDLLGLGSSGNGEIPAVRYGLSYSFAHTANSVTFSFAGSNLQGWGDEGWVLDNVVVSVTDLSAPTISGDLSCNSVNGNGFASNSSVSVVVKDAPGGATVYTNPSVPTDGNGNFNLFCGFGPDLVPGMEITVSDGTSTKVLVLADLTIDAVDPGTNMVSGTAPANSSLFVGVNNPPPSGGGANLPVTADGTGNWSVDFTGTFDITGSTNANASVPDGDGDSTNVNSSAPVAPAFEGSLSGDYAAGCGFSANASVDVSVYDAPGGTLLMSGSAPSDDGGCFNFNPGVDLVPGMFITVDDGTLLKELELVPLSIDVIDPPNDRLSGTALANTTFNVDAFVEEGWVSAFPVTSDGAGAWTAEFGPLGADINPFTHVGANIGDDDGDQTIFDTQLQQGGQNAFTDPNEFQNAIGSHTVIDFNEIDASPVNNTWVGRDPFDGAHYAGSGITFSNPNGYNLYIAPGGLFWNESNSLSVRQFPFDENADDGNDDDLVVDLVPARIAVGFTMVDNGSHDEFIQFLDADGNLVDQVNFPNDYANHRAFIGIVSTDRPIAKIKIVELAFDGDDVDYDDFILVDTLSASDLALTKTGPPGRVPTGRNMTYTLTVANIGPDAASGVTVTDQLPSSVTFVSATPSQGSCGESGGIVTCNLTAMGSGATATVNIVVKPTVVGTITNTASVTASTPDPNHGNNSDSESTSICRITSRRSSIPCG